MGDFRIVIEAAGGHGCNRAAKEGEEFYGCGRMDCPDCVARRVVDYMRVMLGWPVSKATFTHWPADMEDRNYTPEGEVVDSIIGPGPNKRLKGQF